MTALLGLLFGRLPIGWLQLSHNRARLIAAIAGVAFANILVFVQLGIQGAMTTTSLMPYQLFRSDIILAPSDARTFSDGGNIARQRMFQALGVPGVTKATPLYIGLIDWQLSNGDVSTVEVYGIDPLAANFAGPKIREKLSDLVLQDTAIVDRHARGIDRDALAEALDQPQTSFEFNGKNLTIVDSVEVGGGFSADGTMFVSDQTFLRLFPKRARGAPNRILVDVAEGLSPETVATRIRTSLAVGSVLTKTFAQTAIDDLSYQTTERPTGIIFGFGVLIGILVGIVIVYQVLSTDVANHLREYATFKAMGYATPFFLGIVFEQALVLAVLGFLPGLVISLAIYAMLGMATGLPIDMDAGRIVMVFVGTLAACSLSGSVATRRLAAADPADLF